MGVALQDLHGVAVGDVIEADPIGCQDLITHFYAVLLCKTTRVQPEETDEKKEKKSKVSQLNYFHFKSEMIWKLKPRVQIKCIYSSVDSQT